MIKTLKSYSPKLDWQVKSVLVGDRTVRVPVFTAAGVLLPD